MFDYQSFNKIAQEGYETVNAAALEFTRSVLETTQKTLGATARAAQTASNDSLAREWADLYQDQFKSFASLFAVPAVKAKASK